MYNPGGKSGNHTKKVDIGVVGQEYPAIYFPQ